MFAGAIFLSAFLLFLVQPLMGKYILPWFGGSPGVWTTCLLFFQLVLLFGYAYAFFTSMYLSGRWQAALHLILLAVACALLPIIPSEQWRPVGAANPSWRILLLLTVTLGLPYLVLSSTGPLLQAWYSRLNDGVSPYRLYALSNAGSLLALLAYPVLFEPLLTRKAQAWLWSAGLIAFAFACGLCAWLARGFGDSGRLAISKKRLQEILAAQPEVQSPAVPLLWLSLPACATMFLLAATNKICQDIAVIPFLWIVPLSLYLLSFILCFDHPRWYRRSVFGPLWLVALGGATLLLYTQTIDTSILLQGFTYCLVLFIGCMVCHGELARLKPHPQRLTQYYLFIAAGGALGGLFVALIAPRLFSDYYELHLALFFVGVLMITALWADPASPMRSPRRRGVLGFAAVTAGMSGMVLALYGTTFLDQSNVLGRWRNFYGVLTVFERDADHPKITKRILHHGGITHGLQYTDKSKRREATTYYREDSGVGLAMGCLPTGRPRNVGLVGLGVGTLATYGMRGDNFTFYEINPQVERIARTEFTFLADSPANVQVLLGDARVTMEHHTGPQHFDLLVLDAFSGDAIPVHLLTKEAFELYARHMAEHGMIAVHVSNLHLNLAPVVLRQAQDAGLDWALIDHEETEDEADYTSHWVILADKETLQRSEIVEAATPISADGNTALWTDEYSSLVHVLRWDQESEKLAELLDYRTWVESIRELLPGRE